MYIYDLLPSKFHLYSNSGLLIIGMKQKAKCWYIDILFYIMKEVS